MAGIFRSDFIGRTTTLDCGLSSFSTRSASVFTTTASSSRDSLISSMSRRSSWPAARWRVSR